MDSLIVIIAVLLGLALLGQIRPHGNQPYIVVQVESEPHADVIGCFPAIVVGLLIVLLVITH